MCRWGEDRSPDVSSPEQERVAVPPLRHIRRRRDTGTSAGQINYMEAEQASANPSNLLSPTTQQPKPTTWHRTETAMAAIAARKRPASGSLSDAED